MASPRPDLRDSVKKALSSSAQAASTAVGGDDGRVRFLRACDRCRKRKMKCDSENPCRKCLNAGLKCTFNSSAGPSRVTLTARTAYARHVTPVVDASAFPQTSTGSSSKPVKVASAEGGALKRKRTESENPTQSESSPVIFGHNQTAHFYTTQHGVARFAGSTSGLPLLDTVRQELKSKDEVRRPLESHEPDWGWLSSLLQSSPHSKTSPVDGLGEEDELEYFPGDDDVAESTTPSVDIFALIAETIPPDLLLSLVRIYFEVVHPKWPMIHPSTFFSNFYKWKDHAYAALVVSMCMVSSRYSHDNRVRADPNNPASAGVRYFSLFRQLRDQAINRDNLVYAIQSLFLASQYHCVDNVPHPVATSLLAEASARCLDGGLHRETPNLSHEDSIYKQTRVRTAWAVYIFDKQLSAVCGRPPFLRLTDWEVSLPTQFEKTEPTSTEQPPDEDQKHVQIFAQIAVISVILEKTVWACNHPGIFYNSDLLTRISSSMFREIDDKRALEEVVSFLSEWKRDLPEHLSDRTLAGRLASPMYSPAGEQLAALEITVELLVAGRKMQLAMLAPKLNAEEGRNASIIHEPRAAVLSTSRQLVSLVINLGSNGLLGQADISYLLLLAGRMILAVLLSARGDGDSKQVTDAEAAVQAVAVLLSHLAVTLPITVGASEVFNETCRVCRVILPASQRRTSLHPRYAWYRPINYRSGRLAPPQPDSAESENFSLFDTPLSVVPGMPNPEFVRAAPPAAFTAYLGPTLGVGPADIDPNSLFMDLQGIDSTYDAVHMASQGMAGFRPMSGGNEGGEASEADFAWFLLGGNMAGGNVGG